MKELSFCDMTPCEWSWFSWKESSGKAQIFHVAILPKDGQSGREALSLPVPPLLFLPQYFRVYKVP